MKYYIMDSNGSPLHSWDSIDKAYLELSGRHISKEEKEEFSICGFENGKPEYGPFSLKEFLAETN